MAYVENQGNESFENLYKKFKRKVFNEGILKDVKKHEEYLKPSEKRRLYAIEKKKRIRKLQSRENSRGTF